MKKVFISVQLLTFVLIANLVQGSTYEPITHWRFDETSGVSAADSSTNALNGIVSGATWTAGNVAGALAFDGETSVVRIPGATSAVPSEISSLDGGTISFWVKYHSISNGSQVAQSLPVLYFGQINDTTSQNGLEVYIGHNNLADPAKRQLYITIHDAGVVQLCFDSKDISLIPDEWYHYAAVIGPLDHRGYINGQKFEKHYNAGTTNTDHGFFSTVPEAFRETLTIGYGRFSSQQFWRMDGVIDDVRIYDRQLSDSEILNLFEERNKVTAGNEYFNGLYDHDVPAGILDGTQKTFLVTGYSTSHTPADQPWPTILQGMLNDHAGNSNTYFVYRHTVSGTPIATWTDICGTGQHVADAIELYVSPGTAISNGIPKASVMLAQQSLQGAFGDCGDRFTGVAGPDDQARIDQGEAAINDYMTQFLTSGVARAYMATHIYKTPDYTLDLYGERYALAEALDTVPNLYPGPELWEVSRSLFPDGFDNDLVHPGPELANAMALYWYIVLAGDAAKSSVMQPVADAAGVPVPSAGGSLPVPNPEMISAAPGSPFISDDPVLQNAPGDNFDFNTSSGSVSTVSQGGFGEFGNVFVNYDETNLYIGAEGVNMSGTNNASIIFLGLNTLTDDKLNLWAESGQPNLLDDLHNLAFTEPMDIAIVLGDEYGDGQYPSFGFESGDDFGQGIYYLSDTSFVQVAGAKLSQFDGTGSAPTTTDDDDLNRQTDRWEVSIPWVSLNASSIGSVTSLHVCGIFANEGVVAPDRYLSGNYLGESASSSTNLDANNNFGFGFVSITPHQVMIPPSLPATNGVGETIPFVTRESGVMPMGKLENFLGYSSFKNIPTDTIAHEMGGGWGRNGMGIQDVYLGTSNYNWNATGHEDWVLDMNNRGFKPLIMFRNTPDWARTTQPYDFITPGKPATPGGEHWYITPNSFDTNGYTIGYLQEKYAVVGGELISSTQLESGVRLRFSDDQDWVDFVVAAVGHFSAPPYNVTHFQLGNEHRPESGHYPLDSTIGFAEHWFLPAAMAVHQQYPDIKILDCFPANTTEEQLIDFETYEDASSNRVLDHLDIHVHHYGDALRFEQDWIRYEGYGKTNMAHWATEYGSVKASQQPWKLSSSYPQILGLCLEHDWDEDAKYQLAWWPYGGAAVNEKGLVYDGTIISPHGEQHRTLYSLLYGNTFQLHQNISAVPDPAAHDYMYGFDTDRGVVVAMGLSGWTPGDSIDLTLQDVPPGHVTVARSVDCYGEILENLVPQASGGGLEVSVDLTLLPDVSMETIYIEFYTTASPSFEPSCASPLPDRPRGLYVLGGGSGSTDAIRDYDFITGFSQRMPWSTMEPDHGLYDFSLIEQAITNVQALGQQLNLEVNAALVPDYIVTNASVETWTHMTFGETAVPWDTFTLDRYEILLDALANYLVPDTSQGGVMVRLVDHPSLKMVAASLPGLSSIRDTSKTLVELASYSRTNFTASTLRALHANRNTFTNQFGFLGFFKLDDNEDAFFGGVPLDEYLREAILPNFNGPGQHTLGFFQETLSDIGPDPMELGVHLAAASEETYIVFQALTSWTTPFTGEDKVTSSNPVTGISFAYTNYGATYVELYASDPDNTNLWDGLRLWADILECDEVDRDFDGLPDDFEREYLGGVTNGIPSSDSDSDGSDDLSEYLGGTSPTNSDSVFILEVDKADGTALISIDAIPAVGPGYQGLSRFYSLQANTNLVSGSWYAVSGHSNILSTGQQILYTNDTAFPASAFRGSALLRKDEQ